MRNWFSYTHAQHHAKNHCNPYLSPYRLKKPISKCAFTPIADCSTHTANIFCRTSVATKHQFYNIVTLVPRTFFGGSRGQYAIGFLQILHPTHQNHCRLNGMIGCCHLQAANKEVTSKAFMIYLNLYRLHGNSATQNRIQ